MSFTTDVSFPRLGETRFSTATRCLNVLYYGRLISTTGVNSIRVWDREVSMSFMTDVSFPLLMRLPLVGETIVSMSFMTDVSFPLGVAAILVFLYKGVSQCPLWRTSHFHMIQKRINALYNSVSMSFMTDVSFPLKWNWKTAAMRKGLNVLYDGCLISTKSIWWFKRITTVSMSFTTNVSFLRIQESRGIRIQWWSQCPLQRTSHFYRKEHIMQILDYVVSMSFTTDVSFLHFIKRWLSKCI